MLFLTSLSVLEKVAEKKCQAQETRRSCNNSLSLQQQQQQKQQQQHQQPSSKRRRYCNRFFSTATTTTSFHAVPLLIAATLAILILPYQTVVANEVLLAETTPTRANIHFNTTTTVSTITATENSPHLANIETNHKDTTEEETPSLIAHKITTNIPISTQNQDKDEDNEILTVLDDDGIVKEVKQAPDFIDSKFDFSKLSALTENLEETIRNSVKTQIEMEQNFGTAALLLLKHIPEGEEREKFAKLASEEIEPPKAKKLISKTTARHELASTTHENTLLDVSEPLDNKRQEENSRGSRKLDSDSESNLNSITNVNKEDGEGIQGIEEVKTDIDSFEPSSTDNPQDDEEYDDDNDDDIDDDEPSENALYNANVSNTDNKYLNNGNAIPLIDFLDLKNVEVSYPVPNMKRKYVNEKKSKAEILRTGNSISKLNKEFSQEATPAIITSAVVHSKIKVYASTVPSEIETSTKALVSVYHNSIPKTDTLEKATSEIKANGSKTEVSRTNTTGRSNSELPLTFGNEGTLSVVFNETVSPEIRPTTDTPIEEFETTQIPPADEQELDISHVVIKKQGVNLNETIIDNVDPPTELALETSTIAEIINTPIAIPEEEDIEGDYSDDEDEKEKEHNKCASDLNKCGNELETTVVTTPKSEMAMNNEGATVNSEVHITAKATTTTHEVPTSTSEIVEEAYKENGKESSGDQIPPEAALTNDVSTPKSENYKLTIKQDVKFKSETDFASETTTEKSTEFKTTTYVPKYEEDKDGIAVSLIGGNIGTTATKGSRFIIDNSTPISNHGEIAAKHTELLAPHVSGQTFNDNLGAESLAGIGKALPKTDVKNTEMNRSTIVIAICSSAAMLFLVISVMIYLKSFHRQHGTLDIEMQEQRCGIDDAYDNDDQAGTRTKLLEVELPTTSAIIIGDESEECL